MEIQGQGLSQQSFIAKLSSSITSAKIQGLMNFLWPLGSVSDSMVTLEHQDAEGEAETGTCALPGSTTSVLAGLCHTPQGTQLGVREPDAGRLAPASPVSFLSSGPHLVFLGYSTQVLFHFCILSAR